MESNEVMFKIAFLDDGIMNKADKLPKIVKKYIINSGQVCEQKENNSTFILSHGTMCFWVFAEYVKSNEYILYDIQILNEYTNKGNIEDLILALQFCYDEGINLINMSLGITHLIREEGDTFLKKLYDKGVCMVAAQNNSNLVTYPACSPYVIGVARDYTERMMKDKYYYMNNKAEKIDIISHCEFNNIELQHGIVMGKQNSFCAPYISALIFNELQKGKTREDIIHLLKKRAICSEEYEEWQYKKLSFPKWNEDIEVPVIGLELTGDRATKYFKELINRFREQDFHAVGIWMGKEQIDEKAYIFQFQPSLKLKKDEKMQILKWVYNGTNPDIVFWGSNLKKCNLELADLMFIDKAESQSKAINIEEKNVNQIVDMIENYFG